ncbi:PLP-dependent aminotransferase family protein [Brevibacillus borstelensis]|uniref:aminotransferase-like domain-containing protein n=1 Tax=Brevibacillus borstelensis TaxID=45462 RepID=UPI0030BA604D
MHKYLQLQSELESKIESRQWTDGDKLPSIRTLADRYACSHSTVIRALAELERRHVIYSVPKSGYYVVKSALALPEEETGVIDFATSAPDRDVFPYLDFQHCINKAIDTYSSDLFVYGTPQGLDTLIQVIHKQFADYQVFASPKNIFITSGVQQALAVLSAMPFPNRKAKVVLEQPGYHLLIEYLETHNIPVVGVKRTAKGIDLAELERVFREGDVKFFYTMPRFQSPLGTSCTKQEKLAIIELAEKYDVFIVEDDHMADFEQDSKADPLFAYDRSARAIYLKSYSKILLPGLRVGVAVIPSRLVDVFQRYKRLIDIDTSMLSQAALEIYIKSGMFERHRHKIRASYAKRSDILAASIHRHFGPLGGISAICDSSQPMIHTHMALDRSISVPRVISLLKKDGIVIEPIDKHYLSSYPKENLVKLNVSNTKDKDIDRGICRLAETVKKLADSRR